MYNSSYISLNSRPGIQKSGVGGQESKEYNFEFPAGNSKVPSINCIELIITFVDNCIELHTVVYDRKYTAMYNSSYIILNSRPGIQKSGVGGQESKEYNFEFPAGNSKVPSINCIELIITFVDNCIELHTVVYDRKYTAMYNSSYIILNSRPGIQKSGVGAQESKEYNFEFP